MKRRRGGTRRRRGETQVVMDFTTWLGLDDPPMVAGRPIPADIARDIAATTGSLRRIVTDPADGHLIDHGDRIYLPDDLRRHVIARDAHCQAPGCRQPADRCELEHITPFPAGASSTTNTDTYCRRDHISENPRGHRDPRPRQRRIRDLANQTRTDRRHRGSPLPQPTRATHTPRPVDR